MDEEKGHFIDMDEEQDGITNDVFFSFILILLLSERTQHLIEVYTLKDDGDLVHFYNNICDKYLKCFQLNI